MTYLNLTGDTIYLNDDRVLEPRDQVATVIVEYQPSDDNSDIFTRRLVSVDGLPDPQEGVVYIVRPRVREMVGSDRDDVVSPAFNHPDTRHDMHGVLLSIPGFEQ